MGRMVLVRAATTVTVLTVASLLAGAAGAQGLTVPLAAPNRTAPPSARPGPPIAAPRNEARPGAPGDNAPASEVPAARPKTDPLDRPFAVEVRSATVADLARQLSSSLEVRLETAEGIGASRVSLLASQTSARDIQQALASLFRSRWTLRGTDGDAGWRLEANDDLQTAAEGLRRVRHRAFLAGLLQTELDVQRRDPARLAAGIRESIRRRMPELPGSTLERIDGDYLQLTLLLAPIRYAAVTRLLQQGAYAVPLRSLNPRQREIMAAFYRFQAESETLERRLAPAEEVLTQPEARAEYRFLFGDRWTGELLQIRVGLPDSWATVRLPATLFPLPDYASLYPEARERPADPALNAVLDVRIDPAEMPLDLALAQVARTARVNIACESLLRPEALGPADAGAPISGTLGQVLDRLAERYGCFWWKSGNYFLFRSRLFHEYRTAEPPDAALRSLAANLDGSPRLSAASLLALAALPDEQLLTLDLHAAARGRNTLPLSRFDWGELEVARFGLMLAAGLTSAHLEMARGGGVPLRLLPGAQRDDLLAFAAENGFVVDPRNASFRIEESFRRERLPTGAAHLGEVTFHFDFGEGARTTTLGLRLPARDVSRR